jgi:hypothetical protein
MAGSLIIVSLTTSSVFVILVVLAHILNPEIEARWRMLSELSIGRWGWVMNTAFLAWSASNIALALALWPILPQWTTVTLIVVSLGPLGAAFATADPITTPRDQISAHARWHSFFGALFILGLPAVAILVTIATIGERRLGSVALALAIVVWASLIGFLFTVVRWRREGRQFGPSMPIGILNRIFAAAFIVWTVGIALVAWPVVAR